MSVISKKIASAADQPLDRPDAEALAQVQTPELTARVAAWLGMELLESPAVSAEWIAADALELPDIVMTRVGRTKSSRAVVALSTELARSVVGRLLKIDIGADPSLTDMLQPYLVETVQTLAEGLDALPILTGLSGSKPDWSLATLDKLKSQFGEVELVRISLSFETPEGQPTRIDLVLSPDVVERSEAEAATPTPSPDAPKPPRLGPCHVEIQAIADRVRMSVADCSRLEIGQVVALPGLRFDHLELNVEMGEGPEPLVDAALGADRGRKAVRLNRGLDPSFRAPLPSADPTAPGTALALVR